jgi:hypothetical protein
MSLLWHLKAYGMWCAYYLKNLALSLDQLLNTVLGGDPDETLSRRAGRARNAGEKWGCILCKYLDKIDPRHCEKTLEAFKFPEGYHSTSQKYARWLAENTASPLVKGLWSR